MAKQDDIEELLEDLRQEEAVCEGCEYLHTFMQSDACEACGTNGNIKDIKDRLEELQSE